MRTVVAVALSLGLMAATAAAGEPPKQNHHCKLPDGSMDMAKTKKECKAAKGTWAKDAPAADAKAPAAPKSADPAPAAK